MIIFQILVGLIGLFVVAAAVLVVVSIPQFIRDTYARVHEESKVIVNIIEVIQVVICIGVPTAFVLLLGYQIGEYILAWFR